MPKPTFFNLPAEKRERFVEAALEEFARHPYDTASVSAIVERLGIAKGSVYQYFESKRELFEWLVLEAGNRARAWLALHPIPPDVPFFERLRIQYRLGMEQWREAPLWSRVRTRVVEPTRDEALEGFRREIRRLGHAYVRDLLRDGQKEGAVRDDLDVDVAAWFLVAMLQQGVTEALMAKAGIDLAHLPDNPDAAAAIPQEALLAITDVAVDVLMRGVGARGGHEEQPGKGAA